MLAPKITVSHVTINKKNRRRSLSDLFFSGMLDSTATLIVNQQGNNATDWNQMSVRSV